MPLSWNEIKSKALAFSKTWADATREDSEAKPFWIDFFEIFGIGNKRVATFEHAVKKLPGAHARTDGFVDLFWPGMLLVEHKSRGKDLDRGMDQAMAYPFAQHATCGAWQCIVVGLERGTACSAMQLRAGQPAFCRCQIHG
ncbi:MAG: hypothetical protein QG554_446 [Pseudomonadota bacterium]|nr:hypothetical protein [Pseudomonadota bacterium]